MPGLGPPRIRGLLSGRSSAGCFRLAAFRPAVFDGVDRESRAVPEAELSQDFWDVVAGGPLAYEEGARDLGVPRPVPAPGCDNALIRLAHVRGRYLVDLGGTGYLATG